MTTVIVAGALANKAGNGGAAWTRLSWALGFTRLGFDVHLVEQLAPRGPDGPEAVAFFARVTDGFGLPATLLAPDGAALHGCARADLRDLAASASLLVNVSGHLTDQELLDLPGARVFVDLDPGYTQHWHDDGTAPLLPHDHWYTVGTAVGTDRCAVPTGAVPWRSILQPVVLDEWPAVPRPGGVPRFTTVAAWRGPAGTIQVGDRHVGPKAHQFRRFLPLPREVDVELELALDIHPADAPDREALTSRGWRLADPGAVAGDPWTFRDYVQGSHGEWSVAQGLYVALGCGWVSDRTTRYLASGRPAVVQDTGLAGAVPVGEGLVTFTDLPGAVRALEDVLGDHDRHAAAARRIAESHFDARVVLGRLCEDVGVAP